jgi:hypothetical protein
MNHRIISSSFFAIFVNGGLNYAIEGLYFLIQRHVLKEKKNDLVYSALFFTNMIACGIIGAYTNGYTQ